MNLALALAAECVAHGDVPVGALVLDADGVIIGRGRNQREELGDPTAHAEVIALDRKSTRLNSSHIPLSRMPSSA